MPIIKKNVCTQLNEIKEKEKNIKLQHLEQKFEFAAIYCN